MVTMRLCKVGVMDDLIVFTEANETSIRNVKLFLIIFEIASGLSLNTKKTKLYGVNVSEDNIKEWSNAINCYWGKLPTEALFDWETNIWDAFLKTINRAAKCIHRVDTVRRIGVTNRFYTPKALNKGTAYAIWKKILSKLTPPKVEAFSWKVIHQRIPTLSELLKRGVMEYSLHNANIYQILLSGIGGLLRDETGRIACNSQSRLAWTQRLLS
ncbi:hypothetical protein V6N11_052482 [Hibiscus sabdariffa]|uniref:Reverse transcriptase zinc-binding domain-containing protein n=1 Tax=Hibiscus sabdariffa TaxID=183260 RepID=A0ABR2UAV0_9ROSI